MTAVVQRVASASVEVSEKNQLSLFSLSTTCAGEGRIVSEIGPGLLVLGIHESDVDSDADYIYRKVLSMRLFPNEKTGTRM
ncbi:uncharacterized protein LOC130759743 [Actinidia eriantha]|uniref:uncharacterized protein LOC130759740 n=1 Tax=Actinidia eriantha TaxID=165200 RepID=UPI00258F16CC|nr:uncharacterized protein LOC130759740 [Actinidia eriantha]XP_057470924.1 uncharacterized protein LOC130759743 [Actinidia eriantha]